MSQVTFIDTTVLCNLVPVPGRDQHRNEVRAEMAARLGRGEQFILPITAVIETGNFIAQLADGRERRRCAQTLGEMLRLVCERKAPWCSTTSSGPGRSWRVSSPARTPGRPFIELATQGLGAGDLCILTERAAYRERVRLDGHLVAGQGSGCLRLT